MNPKRIIYIGRPDGTHSRHEVASVALDNSDLMVELSDGRLLLLAAGQWTFVSEPRREDAPASAKAEAGRQVGADRVAFR